MAETGEVVNAVKALETEESDEVGTNEIGQVKGDELGEEENDGETKEIENEHVDEDTPAGLEEGNGDEEDTGEGSTKEEGSEGKNVSDMMEVDENEEKQAEDSVQEKNGDGGIEAADSEETGELNDANTNKMESAEDGREDEDANSEQDDAANSGKEDNAKDSDSEDGEDDADKNSEDGKDAASIGKGNDAEDADSEDGDSHTAGLLAAIFGEEDDDEEDDGDTRTMYALLDEDEDDEDLIDGVLRKKKKKKKHKNSSKKKRGKKRKRSSSKKSRKRKKTSKDASYEEEGGTEPSASAEDNPKEEEGEDDFVKSVLDKMKKKKTRRKKNYDVPNTEALEQTISKFIADMEDAAQQDIDRNQEGKPAVAKLRMLPEVNKCLGKVYLHETLLYHDVLKVVRKWLEPLPDGSFPTLNIRSTLLSLLDNFKVGTNQLRDSGIGKVVMFLWKSKQETQRNKKIAESLIHKWSRPIFAISDNYAQLRLLEQEEERKTVIASPRSTRNQVKDLDLDNHNANARDHDLSYHAHIPQKSGMDYTRRPASRVVGKVDRPQISYREKKFAKKLAELKVKRRRESRH
eukprot:TRINITY_DN6175_c0_g1_i4.p1 TRINITY_DN6175_c0_g1~~TRINITY_DN6175_c0_g1_i4.p1  ORF type:complete len:575 (-),score=188.96 TRINITY_DN6175_c0_g1_i4:87-1811(-)